MTVTLVPQLLDVSPHAVLVMVTNPVDVLTYAALTFSSLPPSRVLGTGTVLDSSRLRDLLARHCGVAVQSVHAWIAGEHGDSEFPLWSSATVGSVPLDRISVNGRPPVDEKVGHRRPSGVGDRGRRLPFRRGRPVSCRPGRVPVRPARSWVGSGPLVASAPNRAIVVMECRSGPEPVRLQPGHTSITVGTIMGRRR